MLQDQKEAETHDPIEWETKLRRLLCPRALFVNYDPESGGSYITEQGGRVLTLERLQEIVREVVRFVTHYGDDVVEVLNKEWDDYQEQRRHGPKQPTQRTPTRGYVYLIRAENGLYKIGKAQELSERMKVFSVKFPMKWELIHTFTSKDYGTAEKALHNLFQEKRDVGEWFKLLPEDITYIKSIQDGQL